MIPSSLPLKTGALFLAAAVNGALLTVIFRDDPVRMEGGAEQSVASLGSSFADLAQGTMSAEEAPAPVSPDTPTPAEPVEEAEPTQTPPKSAAPAAPEAPAPQALAALAPDPASPLAATPPEPAEEVETAPPPPETETETVEAEETEEAEEPGTVRRSPRPEGRADRTPPPEPQRTETRRAPAEAAPRGNAQTSARTGSATGDSAAQAQRSSQGQGQSSQAGNAAASNYPGEVMGKLSRIRRPSVRTRGTATVAFSIAGSGGLASVAVARSSGSGALDREAMRLVQRAAPFPPPPAGAQTRFSINISGR